MVYYSRLSQWLDMKSVLCSIFMKNTRSANGTPDRRLNDKSSRRRQRMLSRNIHIKDRFFALKALYKEKRRRRESRCSIGKMKNFSLQSFSLLLFPLIVISILMTVEGDAYRLKDEDSTLMRRDDDDDDLWSEIIGRHENWRSALMRRKRQLPLSSSASSSTEPQNRVVMASNINGKIGEKLNLWNRNSGAVCVECVEFAKAFLHRSE